MTKAVSAAGCYDRGIDDESSERWQMAVDMESLPSFDQLLRRARRVAGLTQEQLAERAGLSARVISDIERGVIRAPRQDTLKLLSDALGLDADEAARWERLRRQLSMRDLRPASAPAPATPTRAAPRR